MRLCSVVELLGWAFVESVQWSLSVCMRFGELNVRMSLVPTLKLFQMVYREILELVGGIVQRSVRTGSPLQSVGAASTIHQTTLDSVGGQRGL